MTDKFCDKNAAAERLKALGDDFAIVQNPSYVFPTEEYYPLAPVITGGLSKLAGIVCDMDGTTTTTENLCLHSLETMVRRITGRLNSQDWEGLDHVADYPHIIGNSTTRHVEYLIKTYGKHIDAKAFVRAVLEAAAWTLVNGADPGRRIEVASNLKAMGWTSVLEQDNRWTDVLNLEVFDAATEGNTLDALTNDYHMQFQIVSLTDQVRLAVDVYYYRYHEILSQIARGEGARLSEELLNGQRLIEPMPGVAIFLALIKGWIGEKAGELFDVLAAQYSHEPPQKTREQFTALGARFQAEPAKIAIVTSSIKYEADIVLNEVFKVIREDLSAIPETGDLAGYFDSIDTVYDAFITASDSSEIRLKPHRDLYSIALHSLGIEPADFNTVAGFEDSESGTIAIRAAGIGLCLAVPFSDTAGHDFSAASHILKEGLPEAILDYNLFLA